MNSRSGDRRPFVAFHFHFHFHFFIFNFIFNFRLFQFSVFSFFQGPFFPSVFSFFFPSKIRETKKRLLRTSNVNECSSNNNNQDAIRRQTETEAEAEKERGRERHEALQSPTGQQTSKQTKNERRPGKTSEIHTNE